MSAARAMEPVRALARRLTAAYCVACALVFAVALGSLGAVWQVRASTETEAACANILSLVLKEVSASPSSDLDGVRALLERPAFSKASARVVDQSGRTLLEAGAGDGGKVLTARAETLDGRWVDVEAFYASGGPLDAETLPAFALALAASAALVAASSRWFVRAAVAPVEESLRRQREFVAAASHELRSPLSVMKLDLGAARAKAEEEDAPATCALVKEAESESGGLSLLVDDLLALASGDAQGWNVDLRPCDAEALFVETFDGMDEKAARAGVSLVPDLPAEPLPPLLADERRVAQLLRILLENAIAFSPAGGAVRLSLRAEGRFAVFAAADQGPGIPDADKKRIFERFYQADPARSITAHRGLGLSIAQELVQAHHGWIRVRDNEGGGAVFEVGLSTDAQAARISPSPS